MKTQPIRTGLILIVILLGSSEITIRLPLHLYHASPGQENWELGRERGEEFISLMGNRLRCGLTLCSSDEVVSRGE